MHELQAGKWLLRLSEASLFPQPSAGPVAMCGRPDVPISYPRPLFLASISLPNAI